MTFIKLTPQYWWKSEWIENGKMIERWENKFFLAFFSWWLASGAEKQSNKKTLYIVWLERKIKMIENLVFITLLTCLYYIK